MTYPKRSQLQLKFPSFMTARLLGAALTLAFAASPALASDEILHACTPDEELSLSTVNEGALSALRDTIRGKLSPASALEKAAAFRKKARGAGEQALADYWNAQAWKTAGSPHAAFELFASLSARPLAHASAPYQWAALQCVNQIHDQAPSLVPPAVLISALPKLARQARSEEQKAALQETAFHAATLAQSDASTRLLQGPAQDYARALNAARRKDHRQVVALLTRVLAAKELPSFLQSERDRVRLLLARSQYALGQYEQAAQNDLELKKSSNLTPEMLRELAWAHLNAGKYRDAVGVALESQKGALRETFSPESPLIIAMSMNELCQYTEALKAAQRLQSDYRASQLWLSSWQKQGSAWSLYDLALEFATHPGTPSKVPARVASEWISSPIFTASQTEIHGIFGEERALSEVSSSAPAPIRAEIARVKARLEERKRALAAGIESDLASVNRQMLSKLADVGKNMRLVRIEVLSAAGQDMVWKNAHPEFAAYLKANADHPERTAPAWDWGKASESPDGRMEVWEDEVGSFEANLTDQCSKKERFISTHQKR